MLQADGAEYLVLEFVEGSTLAEQLAHGPLRQHEALFLARQISLALEAAHDKGIVHRDLKPANIKVTPDGAVKILDFGLAKVFRRGHLESVPAENDARDPLGNYNQIYATPAYMSPEQTQGKQVDERTDVWAFGCVLYQMLTGRKPFEAKTAPEIVREIAQTEPDWGLLPRETTPEIRSLLRDCLQKRVEARLQHGRDLRLRIEQIESRLTGTSTIPIGYENDARNP